MTATAQRAISLGQAVDHTRDAHINAVNAGDVDASVNQFVSDVQGFNIQPTRRRPRRISNGRSLVQCFRVHQSWSVNARRSNRMVFNR